MKPWRWLFLTWMTLLCGLAGAQTIPGTVVGSRITTGSSNATWGVVASEDLIGGAKQVADPTARDAIPAPRRAEGMLCWVQSEQKLYVLSGGTNNAAWTEFAPSAGGTATNVPILKAGNNITIAVTSLTNTIATDTNLVANFYGNGMGLSNVLDSGVLVSVAAYSSAETCLWPSNKLNVLSFTFDDPQAWGTNQYYFPGRWMTNYGVAGQIGIVSCALIQDTNDAWGLTNINYGLANVLAAYSYGNNLQTILSNEYFLHGMEMGGQDWSHYPLGNTVNQLAARFSSTNAANYWKAGDTAPRTNLWTGGDSVVTNITSLSVDVPDTNAYFLSVVSSQTWTELKEGLGKVTAYIANNSGGTISLEPEVYVVLNATNLFPLGTGTVQSISSSATPTAYTFPFSWTCGERTNLPSASKLAYSWRATAVESNINLTFYGGSHTPTAEIYPSLMSQTNVVTWTRSSNELAVAFLQISNMLHSWGVSNHLATMVYPYGACNAWVRGGSGISGQQWGFNKGGLVTNWWLWARSTERLMYETNIVDVVPTAAWAYGYWTVINNAPTMAYFADQTVPHTDADTLTFYTNQITYLNTYGSNKWWPVMLHNLIASGDGGANTNWCTSLNVFTNTLAWAVAQPNVAVMTPGAAIRYMRQRTNAVWTVNGIAHGTFTVTLTLPGMDTNFFNEPMWVKIRPDPVLLPGPWTATNALGSVPIFTNGDYVFTKCRVSDTTTIRSTALSTTTSAEVSIQAMAAYNMGLESLERLDAVEYGGTLQQNELLEPFVKQLKVGGKYADNRYASNWITEPIVTGPGLARYAGETKGYIYPAIEARDGYAALAIGAGYYSYERNEVGTTNLRPIKARIIGPGLYDTNTWVNLLSYSVANDSAYAKSLSLGGDGVGANGRGVNDFATVGNIGLFTGTPEDIAGTNWPGGTNNFLMDRFGYVHIGPLTNYTGNNAQYANGQTLGGRTAWARLELTDPTTQLRLVNRMDGSYGSPYDARFAVTTTGAMSLRLNSNTVSFWFQTNGTLVASNFTGTFTGNGSGLSNLPAGSTAGLVAETNGTATNLLVKTLTVSNEYAINLTVGGYYSASAMSTNAGYVRYPWESVPYDFSPSLDIIDGVGSVLIGGAANRYYRHPTQPADTAAQNVYGKILGAGLAVTNRPVTMMQWTASAETPYANSLNIGGQGDQLVTEFAPVSLINFYTGLDDTQAGYKGGGTNHLQLMRNGRLHLGALVSASRSTAWYPNQSALSGVGPWAQLEISATNIPQLRLADRYDGRQYADGDVSLAATNNMALLRVANYGTGVLQRAANFVFQTNGNLIASNFVGAFTGNGSSLTNVNALTLNATNAGAWQATNANLTAWQGYTTTGYSNNVLHTATADTRYAPTNQIPTGGTSGQVLTSTGSALAWSNAAAGGGSWYGVPTNNAMFGGLWSPTNDSGQGTWWMPGYHTFIWDDFRVVSVQRVPSASVPVAGGTKNIEGVCNLSAAADAPGAGWCRLGSFPSNYLGEIWSQSSVYAPDSTTAKWHGDKLLGASSFILDCDTNAAMLVGFARPGALSNLPSAVDTCAAIIYEATRSTNWLFKTDWNGTASYTTSSVPVLTNTAYRLLISGNSNTITCSLNGSIIATHVAGTHYFPTNGVMTWVVYNRALQTNTVTQTNVLWLDYYHAIFR